MYLCVFVQVERSMCAERMKAAVMQGVSPLGAFISSKQPMLTNVNFRPADVNIAPKQVSARRRGALGGE